MISRRAQAVPPFLAMELLARAQELERQGRDIIHLEVGEPDFAAPAAVSAAVRERLERDRVGYTAASGVPVLREAIAGLYRRRYGVELSPGQVMITAGASAALQIVMLTVADAGQRLLLTDPGYPCNSAIASVCGLETELVELDAAHGFAPTPQQVAAAWTPSTFGMLLASPANPTGRVLTADELAALDRACRDEGGVLILDEIYHGLCYEDACTSLLQQRQDAIVLGSFSKYFGLTGWRVGWLIAPEPVIAAGERLAQNLFLCPPAASQWAAQAALDEALEPEWARRREMLRQRRDRLVAGLEAMEIAVLAPPQGAFYVYADVSRHTDDALQWCRDLLETTGVVLTPGADFGTAGARTRVRLAYTVDVDRIDEALRRLGAALSV